MIDLTELKSRLPFPLPLPPVPRWVVYVGVVLVPVLVLPFAVIAVVRSQPGPQPRIAIIQDMGAQPKYKTQATSDIYQDHRAMRLPAPGTIARGKLTEDDELHRGYLPGQVVKNPTTGKDEPRWVEGYPSSVKVTEALLRRGQQRYGIYCAVCHGPAGYGDGTVHQRAEKLQTPGWVQPASLHAPAIRQQPNGQIFNTITHGKGNMAAYGAQVPPEDRWAIVAYLRALQRSQAAEEKDVPANKRDALR